MVYHLKLSKVLIDLQPWLRSGLLIGMKGEVGSLVENRYVQREKRSAIGTAFKRPFLDWLEMSGKAGLSLKSLIRQGHVKVDPSEAAALIAIDKADYARMAHIRAHGLDLWGQKLTESLIGLTGLTRGQEKPILKYGKVIGAPRDI